MSGLHVPQTMATVVACVMVLAIGGVASVEATPAPAGPAAAAPVTVTDPAVPGAPAASPGPAAVPVTRTADAQLDPNRRVCRRQETLGSRLRARSVCRTAAEWDAMDARARANAKDMTDTPNAAGTGTRMGGG